MEIDLKGINTFPAKISLFEKSQDLQFEIKGMTFGSGVAVDLSIQKTDREYFVGGSCVADIQMQCARCLDGADLRLTGDLSVIAQIDDPGRSKQFDGEEEVIQLDHTERLCLDEPLRQAFFSAAPLKPLCSENCQGLCPRCGVNRNLTDCDCETVKHDSRWDALGNLLK